MLKGTISALYHRNDPTEGWTCWARSLPVGSSFGIPQTPLQKEKQKCVNHTASSIGNCPHIRRHDLACGTAKPVEMAALKKMSHACLTFLQGEMTLSSAEEFLFKQKSKETI